MRLRHEEQKRQMMGDVLGEEAFSRNLEMKGIQFLFSPDEPLPEKEAKVEVVESEL